MKRINLVILPLLAAVLVSCVEEQKKAASEKVPRPIRIAVCEWCGCMPWFLAKEKKLFERHNVEVELVRYKLRRDASRAFSEGKVDAVQETLCATLRESSKSDRHGRIIALIDTFWADGIVAMPRILSVAELRGKRIGVEVGTDGYYMLLLALNEDQVQEKEVKIVDLPADAAALALTQGRLDAAVTCEPYLSAAAKQISGNIIPTSKSSPGLCVDGLVFRDDVLKARKDEVVRLLRGWFNMLEYWDENPDESMEIMAKALGVKPSVLRAAIGRVGMHSREYNYNMFNGVALADQLRVLGTTLTGLGVLKTPPDPTTLIDASVVLKLGSGKFAIWPFTP